MANKHDRSIPVVKARPHLRPQPLFQAATNEEREEIKRINQAINEQDEDILADYGGPSGAIRAAQELESSSPCDSSSESRWIDEYQCWWSSRVAAIENSADEAAMETQPPWYR